MRRLLFCLILTLFVVDIAFARVVKVGYLVKEPYVCGVWGEGGREEIYGIDVSLVVEAAKTFGWSLEWVFYPTKEDLLEAISCGKVDIGVGGLEPTDVLGTVCTIPYLITRLTVLKVGGAMSLDLTSAKIAVEDTEAAKVILRRLKSAGARDVSIASSEDILPLLASGDVDVIIIDKLVALYLTTAFGFSAVGKTLEEVEIAAIPEVLLGNVKRVMYVSATSSDLLGALDATIRSACGSGKICEWIKRVVPTANPKLFLPVSAWEKTLRTILLLMVAATIATVAGTAVVTEARRKRESYLVFLGRLQEELTKGVGGSLALYDRTVEIIFKAISGTKMAAIALINADLGYIDVVKAEGDPQLISSLSTLSIEDVFSLWNKVKGRSPSVINSPTGGMVAKEIADLPMGALWGPMPFYLGFLVGPEKEVLGFIAVFKDSPFGKEEIVFLDMVRERISATSYLSIMRDAISSIKEDLSRKEKVVELLSELIRKFVRVRKLKPLVRDIIHKIKDAVGEGTKFVFAAVRAMDKAEAVLVHDEGERSMVLDWVGFEEALRKTEGLESVDSLEGSTVVLLKGSALSETLGVEAEYGVVSPIGVGGKFMGAVVVGKDAPISRAEMEIIDTVASHLSTALEVEKLYSDLREHFYSTIRALVHLIEVREPYTFGHSERVATWAGRIARRLGLPEDEIEKITIAGILHDVGKIGIPEMILLKPGPLTPEEFEEVKSHPILGEMIVGDIPGMKDIAKIIRHHHERWDGKGYPDGLAGEEIPLGSRILAVADVFDALTSDRPYRKAMPVQKAVEIIRSGRGTQFDPRLVDVFEEIIRDEGLLPRA